MPDHPNARDGRGQVRSSAEARFSRPFCNSPGTGRKEKGSSEGWTNEKDGAVTAPVTRNPGSYSCRQTVPRSWDFPKAFRFSFISSKRPRAFRAARRSRQCQSNSAQTMVWSEAAATLRVAISTWAVRQRSAITRVASTWSMRQPKLRSKALRKKSQ